MPPIYKYKVNNYTSLRPLKKTGAVPTSSRLPQLQGNGSVSVPAWLQQQYRAGNNSTGIQLGMGGKPSLIKTNPALRYDPTPTPTPPRIPYGDDAIGSGGRIPMGNDGLVVGQNPYVQPMIYPAPTQPAYRPPTALTGSSGQAGIGSLGSGLARMSGGNNTSIEARNRQLEEEGALAERINAAEIANNRVSMENDQRATISSWQQYLDGRTKANEFNRAAFATNPSDNGYRITDIGANPYTGVNANMTDGNTAANQRALDRGDYNATTAHMTPQQREMYNTKLLNELRQPHEAQQRINDLLRQADPRTDENRTAAQQINTMQSNNTNAVIAWWKTATDAQRQEYVRQNGMPQGVGANPSWYQNGQVVQDTPVDLLGQSDALNQALQAIYAKYAASNTYGSPAMFGEIAAAREQAQRNAQGPFSNNAYSFYAR